MNNMIQLTGINKIYRTNEIETQALENVNLLPRLSTTFRPIKRLPRLACQGELSSKA